MFEMYFGDINYSVIFGTLFGIYLILQLDNLVRDVMNFVRGWRTQN